MRSGDVVSHAEMCIREGVSLQRGMNFRIKGENSVILMSRREGAPYDDQVQEDGTLLIYEGHDVKRNEAKFPKQVDQPEFTSKGRLTENGKFKKAVAEKNGNKELVRVYEKIKKGLWVFNGVFELLDCWQEKDENRFVF